MKSRHSENSAQWHYIMAEMGQNMLIGKEDGKRLEDENMSVNQLRKKALLLLRLWNVLVADIKPTKKKNWNTEMLFTTDQ